jgi:hypothetical protein
LIDPNPAKFVIVLPNMLMVLPMYEVCAGLGADSGDECLGEGVSEFDG